MGYDCMFTVQPDLREALDAGLIVPNGARLIEKATGRIRSFYIPLRTTESATPSMLPSVLTSGLLGLAMLGAGLLISASFRAVAEELRNIDSRLMSLAKSNQEISQRLDQVWQAIYRVPVRLGLHRLEDWEESSEQAGDTMLWRALDKLTEGRLQLQDLLSSPNMYTDSRAASLVHTVFLVGLAEARSHWYLGQTELVMRRLRELDAWVLDQRPRLGATISPRSMYNWLLYHMPPRQMAHLLARDEERVIVDIVAGTPPAVLREDGRAAVHEWGRRTNDRPQYSLEQIQELGLHQGETLCSLYRLAELSNQAHTYLEMAELGMHETGSPFLIGVSDYLRGRSCGAQFALLVPTE